MKTYLEGHAVAGVITAANSPFTNLIRINARLSTSVAYDPLSLICRSGPDLRSPERTSFVVDAYWTGDPTESLPMVGEGGDDAWAIAPIPKQLMLSSPAVRARFIGLKADGSAVYR